MDISLHLILIDAKTKEIWQTPNHNNDKRNDDFHRDIKPLIVRRLSQKLKNRFGKNCDIKISDGEIYIISQIFNEETGNRLNNNINTNLDANEFFEKLSKLLFRTILDSINILNFINIQIHIARNEGNIVTIVIELETKKGTIP